jgi:hypothetical protein
MDIDESSGERIHMNTNTCSINAYAVIRNGCPFTFQVGDSDDLEISLGDSDRPLMLRFDAESFRLFLEQGAKAVQTMTAIDASEQTEAD